jgi:hypothetical protein
MPIPVFTTSIPFHNQRFGGPFMDPQGYRMVSRLTTEGSFEDVIGKFIGGIFPVCSLSADNTVVPLCHAAFFCLFAWPDILLISISLRRRHWKSSITSSSLIRPSVTILPVERIQILIHPSHSAVGDGHSIRYVNQNDCTASRNVRAGSAGTLLHISAMFRVLFYGPDLFRSRPYALQALKIFLQNG